MLGVWFVVVHKVDTMPLNYGPLNKNLHTQLLELIVKCLIKAPEKIHLLSNLNTHTDSLNFSLDIDGTIINLSDVLQKTDFSHLSLNDDDSLNYLNKFNLSMPASIKAKFPKLTEAEKMTINSYSKSSESFNSMLYGNKHFKHEKQTIIDCVMLASGLNKIESITMYNLPKQIPNAILPPLQTYRGEVFMTDEIVKVRKSLIAQGGGVTSQSGFMSTSYQRKVTKAFSSESLIIFDSMYGKDISGLATDPREHEFLLTPCQVFWSSFSKEGNMNVFSGQVVTPLNSANQNPTIEEIETFKKILQWANENSIQTDFLTAHLRRTLGLPQPVDVQSTASPQPQQTASPKTFFSKLNSLSISAHPYKTAFFVCMLSLVGSILLGQSMPIMLAVMSGTITLAAISLRNYLYQNAYQQWKKSHLPAQNTSVSENIPFENGCKAAQGWKPYFESQCSAENWRNFSEFAAGYQEETIKIQKSNTPG